MNLLGNPLDFVKAFFAGVAISLTPCIYPLIPITAGYIGAISSGSKRKGFILSLVYVTGVALTYSVLGLVASLTGMFFGRISSSPFTYIGVGVVIILFGLSMLDVINLPMPRFIKLPGFKQKNYLSVLILGLSSGLVASPCLTPALGAILLYLSTKKNILYGSAMLFCFAYGMGVILIIIGTFSSLLVNLPKSGRWLEYIKRIAAAVLLGIGVYFVVTGIRRF